MKKLIRQKSTETGTNSAIAMPSRKAEDIQNKGILLIAVYKPSVGEE
jgi:hypothetical protein